MERIIKPEQYFADESERRAAIEDNLEKWLAVKPGDKIASQCQSPRESQTIGIVAEISIEPLGETGAHYIEVKWGKHVNIAADGSTVEYDGGASIVCTERNGFTMVERAEPIVEPVANKSTIDRRDLTPGTIIEYGDIIVDDSKPNPYVSIIIRATVDSWPTSQSSGTVAAKFRDVARRYVESGDALPDRPMWGEGFTAGQVITLIGSESDMLEEDSGFAEVGSDAARFGQGSALVSESIMGDDSDEVIGTHTRPSMVNHMEEDLRHGFMTRDEFDHTLDMVVNAISRRSVSLVRA